MAHRYKCECVPVCVALQWNHHLQGVPLPSTQCMLGLAAAPVALERIKQAEKILNEGLTQMLQDHLHPSCPVHD